MSTVDQKTLEEVPPYTVTVPSGTEKKRSTKKYVIIAVSGILTAIIILTAILVGIYLFYNAQKDILKFSLILDKNTKQDVTSDSDNNVVQYYIQNPNYKLWVINDFNKDIQIMKVIDATETVCYVTPLNRTSSISPSDINKFQSNRSETAKAAQENVVKYRASDSTIPDISFLCTTANDLCKGVSAYWIYPYCDTDRDSTGTSQRQRRGLCTYLVNYCCEYNYQYGYCTTYCPTLFVVPCTASVGPIYV